MSIYSCLYDNWFCNIFEICSYNKTSIIYFTLFYDKFPFLSQVRVTDLFTVVTKLPS